MIHVDGYQFTLADLLRDSLTNPAGRTVATVPSIDFATKFL